MKALWLLLLVTAIPAVLGAPEKEDPKDMEPKGVVVVDFTDPQSGEWLAVNDGVMGGLSQSRLRRTDDSTGVFAGVVSLENNGGFASVRASLENTDLSEYDGLTVRVLGDGKRYRLRLRTDKRFDGVAYQAIFNTTGEGWQVVVCPDRGGGGVGESSAGAVVPAKPVAVCIQSGVLQFFWFPGLSVQAVWRIEQEALQRYDRSQVRG